MKEIKIKKSTIALIAVYVFTLVTNGLSWVSKEFIDGYAKHIYPVFANAFARITSPIPFSLGEALIAVGIVIIAVGLPVFIIALIVSKGKRKKIAVGTGKFVLWTVGITVLLINLNYLMLNHCTDFSTQHYEKTEYSEETFLVAYEQIIDGLCKSSNEIKRDEEGYFVMSDDLYSTAKSTMKKLGEQYPQFKGFYPNPKKMLFPKFRAQMGISGLFTPYTMEANYNPIIHQANIPDTVCHELAHLKGIAKEDEANFIAFLACINSESADFRYSGYLNAFSYMCFATNATPEEGKLEMRIPREVFKDLIFLKEEEWDKVEQTAVIPTEVVEELSHSVIDTQIKINGVEDGIKSYNRVTKLFMDYYGNETEK